MARLAPRLLGLLLACAISGCASTPRSEAVASMTGFELEVLRKLETLRKGMTPEQVVAVMGPNDDGSLFQDAARYWILSTRPIIAVLPQPAVFQAIELCIVQNGGRIVGGVGYGISVMDGRIVSLRKDEHLRLAAGTYRCNLDSPAELARWHSALAAELPAGARIETPVDPRERDAVAKVLFSGGRLSSVYLIHPAPSRRGAFHYTVLE